MAGSFVINGTLVTVKLEYTAPIEKTQETVFGCAKSLYQGGSYLIRENPQMIPSPGDPKELIEVPGRVIPFEELTTQQKLSIVDQFVLQMIVERAREQLKSDAVKAAMEAASNEADEKFI